MRIWTLLKEAATNWSEHKDARSGAALAYYSVFSIGPVIVIAIAIAGLAFGREAVQGQVSAQLQGLLGETGAKAVDGMLVGASKPQEGMLATLFGIAMLVFAALGVVVQLKDALNTVWEVPEKNTGGLWGFLRTYLVSLAAVLSLGFLLLVSLLFTTLLAAGAKYIEPWLPEAAMQLTGFGVSFAFITVLFAMMFKWLPDAHIAWGDVWLGAAVTAFMFEIGKLLIGLYIGKQGLESTYGAAASLVVVLIWVYYSSQLVLMGAEFTRAYAERHGSRRPALESAAVNISPRGVETRPAVQTAIRLAPPYAAALAGLAVGWLLSLAREGFAGPNFPRATRRVDLHGSRHRWR